jgi:hypothetical protein
MFSGQTDTHPWFDSLKEVLMRLRFLALLLPLAAVPATAATVHLKLKADDPAAGQPVKVTLRALSRVPVSLPAEPIVYVDEGHGFKVRPELRCHLANGDAAVRLEADRELTASCELPLPTAGRQRVRFGYRLGETVSTSNTVTIEVNGPARASAAQ